MRMKIIPTPSSEVTDANVNIAQSEAGEETALRQQADSSTG